MQYYLEIFLLSILILNSIITATCLNIAVDFDLVGEGFHRSLEYSISFDGLNQVDCAVALHVLLPSAIYINVDEVADLKRQGKARVCSQGETDVELFAENAESQNVTICEQLISSEINLSLPVHQRYQFARADGDYLDVLIPQPKLLLGCKNRIKEYRVSNIDLCAPCVDLARKWREIPYKVEPTEKIWRVPVGNSSYLDHVSCTTLLVTSLGAAVVLRVLLQSGIKSRSGVKVD
ncbi:uncharacterized protein LOC105685305 [Athalia rosae]|uniref:uncharacterized protein LOC105685305 n=1 Tax=Athalia rosae TaxID=37344 RepID=UPI0020339367|nr:uncharacterized protein LOC105685305 [Athalia rosae]